MKLVTKSIIAAAVAALSLTAIAQDPSKRPSPGPGGPEGGRGPRMSSPVVEALDANHDGVIDAAEINNASVALRTLDKNSDGQLTAEELRPARPEGGRGPRGEGRPQRPPADQ